MPRVSTLEWPPSNPCILCTRICTWRTSKLKKISSSTKNLAGVYRDPVDRKEAFEELEQRRKMWYEKLANAADQQEYVKLRKSYEDDVKPHLYLLMMAETVAHLKGKDVRLDALLKTDLKRDANEVAQDIIAGINKQVTLIDFDENQANLETYVFNFFIKFAVAKFIRKNPLPLVFKTGEKKPSLDRKRKPKKEAAGNKKTDDKNSDASEATKQNEAKERRDSISLEDIPTQMLPSEDYDNASEAAEEEETKKNHGGLPLTMNIDQLGSLVTDELSENPAPKHRDQNYTTAYDPIYKTNAHEPDGESISSLVNKLRQFLRQLSNHDDILIMAHFAKYGEKDSWKYTTKDALEKEEQNAKSLEIQNDRQRIAKLLGVPIKDIESRIEGIKDRLKNFYPEPGASKELQTFQTPGDGSKDKNLALKTLTEREAKKQASEAERALAVRRAKEYLDVEFGGLWSSDETLVE